MSSPHGVVSHEEDQDSGPDDATPVHLAGIRAGRRWEELEDPEDGQETECGDVDGDGGLAETEAGDGEGFAAESFGEDA